MTETEIFKRELELTVEEMSHKSLRLVFHKKYRAVYDAYKMFLFFMNSEDCDTKIFEDIVSYIMELKKITNKQRVHEQISKKHLNPTNLDELSLSYLITKQQAMEAILFRFSLFS